MLTRKTYKILGQHWAVSYWTTALPFKWDPVTESMTCTTNKAMLFFWYLNRVVSVAMVLRFGTTFFTGVVNGDRDVALLITDCMFLIMHASATIFQVASIFIREDMADLINHIFKFDKLFTNRYCPKTSEDQDMLITSASIGRKSKKEKEETDGCDGNIASSFYMLFIYGIIMVKIYMGGPDNGRYVYLDIMKLLSNPGDPLQSVVLWSWAVVEYIQFVHLATVFNNVMYILTLYAHTTNFWLAQLQGVKNNTSDSKITVEVKPADALLIYKAIRVLNRNFNECIRRILLPAFKLFTVSMHTMAIYVSVMFHERMPMAAYIINPIGTVMWFGYEGSVFPDLGKVFTLSQSYLRSWKPILGTKADKDFQAAFPFGVQVSNYYMIKPATLLTLWSFVFGQAVNCMVMTPA